MISAFIKLIDKVDKHVPDVQVQLFHLHGVDRILHRVDRILHGMVLILQGVDRILYGMVLILQGVVRILHGMDRIFKLLNPLL